MNNRHPTLFDADWLPKPTRPHDSVIFVAYIKQVAPQLALGNKPIHKTNNGYTTNSSPYSEYGQFEYIADKSLIIYRHKVSNYIGNEYESMIKEDKFVIEFKDDVADIKPLYQ